MALLFEPLTLRGTTLPNRAWLPPMCQYSAEDGVPGDWHLIHYGSRAVGGFGLLVAEATAVVPEGRITPADAGLWNEEQTAAWARIVGAVHARGARIAVQLGHAGRKASVYRFHEGEGTVPAGEGGWEPVAPSPVAFPGYAVPAELSDEAVAAVPAAFAAAARRALDAGFDSVEIHAAHGYLLHEFLSPLANHRTDRWGGSPENRARLLFDVTEAVRDVWPDELPLLVRVSATDWVDGGLTVDDVAEVAIGLGKRGVDLIDVSTGGLLPAPVPAAPGYQVPAARQIREITGMPVSAVGLITSGPQAEQLLADGSLDVVMVGRAALREPYWPLRAAHELGVALPVSPYTGSAAAVAPGAPTGWPVQYERGAWTD